MQLIETKVSTFAGGGVGKSLTYSVAQTAKVMELLSKSLYSDYISAIIRELSTNAVDSHKKAGTMHLKPIMELPSPKNGFNFRLRDFGTGLSPDQIEKVYTEYGNSDKVHTNDLNGCMGLGSKSPFSYTSAFTTISYYNGKKYVWVNAKDSKGMPCITDFGVTDTDEPNGLEIQFAAKETDSYDFARKAARILGWMDLEFDVTTRGYGDGPFALHAETYNVDHGWWKIRDGANRSYIIMGGVEYPIETKHFARDKERNNDWYAYYEDNEYAALLSMGLEIHVPMPGVEFDISREKLQYSEYTVNAIIGFLDKIKLEIEQDVSKRISTCQSYIEAWDTTAQMFCSGGIYYTKYSIGLNNVVYNGKSVIGKDIDLSKEFLSKCQVNLLHYSEGSHKYRRINNINHIDYTKHKKLFFVADKDRGNYTAINHYIHANSIRGCGAKDELMVYIFKTHNGNYHDTLASIGFTETDYIKCSTIHIPVEAKTKTTRTKTQRVSKLELIGSTLHTKDVEVDFNAGGCYVESVYSNFLINDRAQSTRSLNQLLLNIKALGITLPNIIAVRRSVSGKYKNSPKWVLLEEVLTKLVSEWIDNNQELGKATVIRDTCIPQIPEPYRMITSLFGSKDNQKLVSEDSLVSQMISTNREINSLLSIKSRKLVDYASNLSSISSMLPVDVPKDSDFNNRINSEIKMFADNYPLLGHLSCWELDSDKTKKDCIHYINLTKV